MVLIGEYCEWISLGKLKWSRDCSRILNIPFILPNLRLNPPFGGSLIRAQDGAHRSRGFAFPFSQWIIGFAHLVWLRARKISSRCLHVWLAREDIARSVERAVRLKKGAVRNCNENREKERMTRGGQGGGRGSQLYLRNLVQCWACELKMWEKGRRLRKGQRQRGRWENTWEWRKGGSEFQMRGEQLMCSVDIRRLVALLLTKLASTSLSIDLSLSFSSFSIFRFSSLCSFP